MEVSLIEKLNNYEKHKSKKHKMVGGYDGDSHHCYIGYCGL